MSAGTSAQSNFTGEPVQVKAFEESNTAAGQGGSKAGLIEVKPKNNPLPGQHRLKESKPKVKYRVPDELRQQHDQATARIKELQAEIKGSPVRDLLGIIKRRGNYKGEVKDLTPRQFEKIFRQKPRPSIIDPHSGKVNWWLALDQIAAERGYKSDESLKEDIERLSGQIHELKALRSEKRGIKSDITTAETKPPKKQIVIVNANPPVFPKGETTKAIVTQVDGYTMEAARNPSFYQISDNDPKTPDVRARYSSDARAIMNDAAKNFIKSQMRLSRGRGRISPKMPRLR